MSPQELGYNLFSFNDSLKGFAYSLTQNPEEVEDLLQETYFKAISGSSQFKEGTNLKGWACTIMRNCFFNECRKKKAYKRNFGVRVDALLSDDYAKHEDPPYLGLRIEEMQTHIDMLEDDLRVPFMLNFEGYKYKEIAEKLNMKMGTVKFKIFDARQKLAESLKDYSD